MAEASAVDALLHEARSWLERVNVVDLGAEIDAESLVVDIRPVEQRLRDGELAGAIIIENVFFLPGLGRLVFNAIGQRDLPVVRDIVLFMAVAVVLVNFIVDLTYAALDPRIRLE